MKSIRATDLEHAFTTMMNKLIFGWQEVLRNLIDAVRGKTHKDKLIRIDEIDRKLEQNVERRQTLTTIMTRGYLEPALFTQESNDLAAEAEALNAEKEHLVQEVTGSIHKTDALSEIIRYVSHADPSPEYNGELAERFLDHVTVRARNKVVFHMKCGLNLTERIGTK
jgi:hypothetical protein